MSYKIKYNKLSNKKINLVFIIILFIVIGWRLIAFKEKLDTIYISSKDLDLLMILMIIELSIFGVFLYEAFYIFKEQASSSIFGMIGRNDFDSELILELKDSYMNIISKNITEKIYFRDITNINFINNDLKLRINGRKRIISIKLLEQSEEIYQKILKKINKDFISL